MGTDLKVKELQRRKEQILQEMVRNLEAWDGKTGSGILLIDENGKMIDELKVLTGELEQLGVDSKASAGEPEQLKRIAKALDAVIEGMLRQKEKALTEEKKVKKKEELTGNYIKKRGESRFIDKKI